MLRSMYTAISALTLHQSYMDVVADNLANTNTYGFKASRMSFQDQIGELLSVGSAPNENAGGVDPTQIGLGVRLGSITAVFSQGVLQATGRNTDMAIQGDGFFIYADGPVSSYSRDGAIEIDSTGYLVNLTTGMRLQGWRATGSGPAATIDTGGPIGAIQLPLGTNLARATSNAILGGNLDATTEVGGSFDITVGAFDSLGNLKSINVNFTKTADNAWEWTASGSDASGSGTIEFTEEGQYASGSGSITFPGTDGSADTTFTVDLSNVTQLASAHTIAATSQDGLAAGSLASFFVTPKTGEIYALYSNGLRQLVGQVALASFVNPSGLIRDGQNMFKQGFNSGEPVVGAPRSGGRGQLVSGYLEGSNVDLAQEFTNMILAQRGFQASSRVITTSDEMLQELVNIKR
jgi:flagellar hook protein FlgE